MNTRTGGDIGLEFGAGEIPDAREHRKSGIKNGHSVSGQARAVLLSQGSAGDIAAGAGVYWVSTAAAAAAAPSKPLPFSFTFKTRKQHGSIQHRPPPTALRTCGKCQRGRGIARRSAPLYRTRTCRAPFRRTRVHPEYTPSTRTSTRFFYREYNILVQYQGVLHVRAARAPLELYFHSVPLYNP